MSDQKAHVRIDEGIKRGPKHQHRPPAKRKDTATGTIPADLSPDVVIEQYLTEATTSQIATRYGVSRKTLVRWLVDQRPKQWREVQVIRALCRKEDADEGIESACDALSLARAREQLRSGQWDLERLDSANYGQQQAINPNAGLPILQITILQAAPVAGLPHAALQQPVEDAQVVVPLISDSSK